MKTITDEQFALLCFVVLMENGDGLIEKHPSYFIEKMHMLHMKLDAFGALDIHNMRRVIQWCDLYHVEVPTKVREHYELELKAAEELKAKGFEI